LLAEIYEQQGKKDEAAKVYSRAVAAQGMPERARAYFKSRLDGVQK